MKALFTTAMIAAPLALGACTRTEPADIPPPSPAAEVVGPAENCLQINRYSSTRIRDDRTIDFISGTGSKAWRVTLPNSCPGLKSADSFTFETSLTQLCSTDIIYPLLRFGNDLRRGAGCGMGQFVPVKLAE